MKTFLILFFVIRETGKIRSQSLIRPTVIKISAPLTTATPKHKTEKTPSPLMPSMTTGKDIFYVTFRKPFFVSMSSLLLMVTCPKPFTHLLNFILLLIPSFLSFLIFFSPLFFCLTCHLDIYFCLLFSPPFYDTTECPPNTTIVPTIAATRPQQNQDNSVNNNSLLRRLTTNQYQSYATALTVTIAVGCFLLLLNVFIFAAIYYQREKRATYTRKKEELTEAENLNSSSSPSLERYQHKSSRKSSLQSVSGAGFGEYSCYDEKLRCKEKRALVDLCTVELPMQDFKYSPPCGSTTGSLRRSITPENFNNKHTMIDHQSSQDGFTILPPSYAPQINGSNNLVTYRSIMIPKTELCNQATQADSPLRVHDASTIVDDHDEELNSELPEAPPPPRSSFQSGILRQGAGGPATPGTTKKRVQIQEISV